MQKLTTEQIQHIDDFLLNHYQVKYQDTRDEIIDHIACEIEFCIGNGNGYDEAFKETFNKWNKDLRPHTWIRYNNVPSFIGRQWIKRDILSISISLVLGIALPYIFMNLIIDTNSSNILGNSFSILSIALGFFINIYFYKDKGYRIDQIKKESLGYLLISLFYFLLLFNHFNYMLLPMPLILMFYQIYYIREVQKPKLSPKP